VCAITNVVRPGMRKASRLGSTPRIPNPGWMWLRPETGSADRRDGPRDGDPLPLSPESLTPARLRVCRTGCSNCSATRPPRDPAGFEDLRVGGIGRANATFSRIEPSNRNVSWRTTPAGCGRTRAARWQVDAVDENRTVVGVWNAATSPMIVDFPAPEGADQCSHATARPGGYFVENLLGPVVGKLTRSNTTSPRRAGSPRSASESASSGGSGALRVSAPVRQRLGQLRPDAQPPDDRRHQERQERREGHKTPRVSVPARTSRAPTYITTAPTAPMNTVAERSWRDYGQRLEHIVQQAPHPASEDRLLPRLRMIPP